MEAKLPAPPGGAAKPKVVQAAYVFRRDGLPRIRKAVLTFAITFGLCVCMVGGIRWLLSRVAPATALAQQLQQSASERYQQAEAERIELRDFQPAFERLRERGFYGDENRLHMLDAIKTIQMTRRLLPLTYTFSPQQVVAVDPALLAPPLELRASRVVVRLQLLHELDLLHFLTDLKAQGFFTVRECQLTRIDVGPDAGLTARMTADCTLYWLSVTEPVAAPVADPAAPVQ